MYIKHAMYSSSPHQNSPADIFSKRLDGEVKVISILVDEKNTWKEKKRTYDFNHYRETFVFFFFGSYIRSIISSDKKGEVGRAQYPLF